MSTTFMKLFFSKFISQNEETRVNKISNFNCYVGYCFTCYTDSVFSEDKVFANPLFNIASSINTLITIVYYFFVYQ